MAIPVTPINMITYVIVKNSERSLPKKYFLTIPYVKVINNTNNVVIITISMIYTIVFN